MKVLVIEDQPSQMKLASIVLKSAGHTVSAAEAAEEACSLILEDRPEIILLDMGLPGMDGLELVKKLKGDPATKSICVVAITSFPEKYSRTEALAAGCDAYLEKPLSTRTLPQDLQNAAKGAA